MGNYHLTGSRAARWLLERLAEREDIQPGLFDGENFADWTGVRSGVDPGGQETSMSFSINSILGELEAGAIDAAKSVAVTMLAEASKDAKAFVHLAVPCVGRYMELFLSKQITKDEFANLMLGLKDLAELHALTLAGATEIEIDKTRNAILSTVSQIALGAVSKII